MATPEISVFHRRAWYVALAISWGCVLTLLNPMGEVVRIDRSLEIWPFVWSGIFGAVPSLFAIWIALGAQPALRRIPAALALATLFGLLAMAGQRTEVTRELTTPVSIAVMLVAQALPLAIVRKWLKWRVGLAGVAPKPGDYQITIVTILTWTAEVGGLLAFANWIVDDWSDAIPLLHPGFLTELLVMTGIYSMILLPVVIAATGAILADWPRRRFVGWLIGIFLCYSFAFGAAFWLMLIGGGGPAQAEAFEMASIPMLVLCGLVGAIVVTLGGLRSCGVRLWREGQRALGEESRQVV